MNNITFEMYLLALLGILIHAAAKVLARTDKSTPLSLGTWIRHGKNWLRMFMSVASVVVLMLTAEDIAKMFGLNIEGSQSSMNILSFVFGYFNHSLITLVLKMFKSKIQPEENEAG
jgi:hypothetical protein